MELPQYAHDSDDVDGDEDEGAGEADFDDSFRFVAFNGTAIDDVFGFLCFLVMLSFDDGAREDDAFEVKDREVVIFELVCCVMGYDVVLDSNEIAEVGDGCGSHRPSLASAFCHAQRPR